MEPKPKFNKLLPLIGGSVLVVVVGVLTGWLLTSGKGKGVLGGSTKVIVSAKPGMTEAGVDDPSVFKDSVEGTLEEGGIKGEGIYHITRPGGATQTVYLTSSTVDMGVFVGKKVQVWGQTISARYAPWLMDVGRIKVLE